MEKDEKNRIMIRPEISKLPGVAQPFYARGVARIVIRNRAYEEYAPPGSKPFVEIFWGCSGSGRFLFPDKSEHPLGAGDVVIRMPGEPHHLCFNGAGTWCYRWLTLDGPMAENFVRAYGYPPQGFHTACCPEALFQKIEDLLADRGPFAWRQMTATVAGILAHAGSGRDESTHAGRLSAHFVRLCHENLSDDQIDVNEIATMLKIDRSTLRRILRETMMTSPGRYLRQMRLQNALNLLQSTDLPVAEIAHRSGFVNFSHFCRIVREETGDTPGIYRDKQRGQPPPRPRRFPKRAISKKTKQASE